MDLIAPPIYSSNWSTFYFFAAVELLKEGHSVLKVNNHKFTEYKHDRGY